MSGIRRTIVLPLLFIFVMGCVIAVDIPNASAAVNNGLVAYYTFEENLNDSSGNGNNGSGIVEYKDSRFGKGVFLDGSNYITVKDSSSLDLTEDFTFAVWLYKEESDQVDVPILRKGKSDDFFEGPYSFFLGLGGRIPSLNLIDENQSDCAELVSGDEVIGTQNWTHVAVTKRGSSVRFYKNGKACGDAEADYVGTLLSNSQDLIIGMDAYQSAYYKGIMDELRIYNRVLTDTEIKALYDYTPASSMPTTPKPTTPLVAHYKFDGNLNDSSEYGNHGTGTVEFKDGKFGKGVYLDGSNYVTVKDSDSLDLTEDFTFAVWLYKEESDEIVVPILRKGKSDDYFAGPYSFFLGLGGRVPSVSLVDENESDCDDLNSDGEEIGAQNWTHVAVTKSGSSVRFYKNGKACGDGECEYVGTLLSNSQDLIIGMDAYHRSYYKGSMDELRIYNKALSDAEIQALYQSVSTTPTTPTAPVVSGAKTTMILQIDNPMVTINGVQKEIDPGYGTRPLSLNGRTLLPVRIIIESLGGRIGWVQNDRKMTINIGNTNMEFWIDKKQFTVNGVAKNTDVAPQIINSRTFLPLRVILENLGINPVWNPQNKTVTIVAGN